MKKMRIALALLISAITASLPSLSWADVTVSNQSAFETALKGEDKNIIVEGAFTTSKNLEIPSGYTVTLKKGATITLGYKNYIIKKTYYSLTGEGTIVTGTMTIKTKETRTIAGCVITAGCKGAYCGQRYDVTEIQTSGGSIVKSGDNTVSVKMSSTLCVDEGQSTMLDSLPAAVICKVGSGINCDRTFVGAYASMEAACNAWKAGHVVVLLQDQEMSVSGKITKSFVLDCARKNATYKTAWSLSGGNELSNGSNLVYLNALTATFPRLVTARATFIGCQTIAQSDKLNNGNASAVHLYDCASLPKFAFEKTENGNADAGIYFFSGGPYATTNFDSRYKVYGGSFTSDPSAYLIDTEREAVKTNDVWKVQKATPKAKVVKEGDTEYTSLAEALMAAPAGATLTLLSNLELTEAVIIDKNLTLELAGYDLTMPSLTITKGAVKIEQRLMPSDASVVTGDIIVAGGILEVTYGTYKGAITVQSGATFIVHHATFDGTLSAEEGATLNLRGGQFKQDVTSFLKDGYQVTSHGGSYWVGQFPWANVTNVTLAKTEKAWQLQGLNADDLKIYAATEHTGSDWYRYAELVSMVTPYLNYTIDCVVSFNRPVVTGSVEIHASSQVSVEEVLDRDLAANEVYRVLSTKVAASGYAQINYSRFLTEENVKEIKAGLTNLSDDNAGTTCTIALHLCETDRATKALVTKYVIASQSYTFPMVEAEGKKYASLNDVPANRAVNVLADTTLTIDAMEALETPKMLGALNLGGHTVIVTLPEAFETTIGTKTLLCGWTSAPATGAFCAESPLTKGYLSIEADGLYYVLPVFFDSLGESLNESLDDDVKERLVTIAAEYQLTEAKIEVEDKCDLNAVTLFGNIVKVKRSEVSTFALSAMAESENTVTLSYDFGIATITIDTEKNVVVTATVKGPTAEVPAIFMDATCIHLFADGVRVAKMEKTETPGVAIGRVPFATLCQGLGTTKLTIKAINTCDCE